MTATLTDRYVHAATRWLPGRARRDVEAELRERIADTVGANGGAIEAERACLEELGDPLRVAVAYTGREATLIGPRFFFRWLRLTLLLVAIVPPIITAIVVTVGIFEGDSFGTVLGSGVSTLMGTIVHVAFWTTLVFAVLDWSNSPNDAQTWTVEDLPAPASGTGTADLVAGLVFLPALAAVLVWQHFGSPLFEEGERVAMLDPALWSWYLPLVIVYLALELIHLFWIHRSGWTWPAAIANAAISVLFAVPTVFVLLNDALLNPELISHLNWDQQLVTDTTEWIAAGVVLVSLWEIFDGIRKARAAS